MVFLIIAKLGSKSYITNRTQFVRVNNKISSHQKLKNIPEDLTISLNSTLINRSKHIKLHGYEHLNFSEHVSYLTKKVSTKIALLHRLRHILPTDILNIVYQTIIQSHFDYHLSVYGNCPQQYINQIQRLQNRAARAIFGDFDYTASVTAMIVKLGWMNIHQRYVYFTAILMFEQFSSKLPYMYI